MHQNHFDTRFHTLTGPRSRRDLLVRITGGLGAMLLLGQQTGETTAKHKKNHRHKKKPQPSPSPPPGPAATPDSTCVTTGARLSNTRLAQTFRALRSGQLISATIFLTHNLAGVDLDVEIWSVDQTNAPSGVLTGATIANVPETVFPGPPRQLTATFATPAAVVAGRRYALVVTGPRNDYSLEGSAENNPCPDGIVYAAFSAAEPFIPVPAEDFHFETIVEV